MLALLLAVWLVSPLYLLLRMQLPDPSDCPIFPLLKDLEGDNPGRVDVIQELNIPGMVLRDVPNNDEQNDLFFEFFDDIINQKHAYLAIE